MEITFIFKLLFRKRKTTCFTLVVCCIVFTVFTVPYLFLLCSGYYEFLHSSKQYPSEKDFIKFCESLPFGDKIHSSTIGTPELGESSPYIVLYNLIQATSSFDRNKTVTFTTHSTPEFLSHVGLVAKYWNAPVSVAVYAPFTDFCLALKLVMYYRVCKEGYFKNLVTWHFFWPQDSPPPVIWDRVPEDHLVNCNEVISFNMTWRSYNEMHYPVNVARNIARNASLTHYVLPSDVELYPSENMAKEFINYVNSVEKGKAPYIGKGPQIYVVPVFEVMSIIPRNKEELIDQYVTGSAVYFHKMTFSVVKRRKPYHRWEPVFICTNEEPFYSEKLSWEGLQDKMAQMHELCLKDYNVVILDRAFLVHAPGIKYKKNKEEMVLRKPFIKENSNNYYNIISELHEKYGSKVHCKPNL